MIPPATISAAPASPAPASNGDTAKLKAAAKQFEAIFVRQMLAEARKTSFGGDELFGGQEMDTFRQMQDEHFAEIASDRGVLGLAAQVEKQLAVRLGGTGGAS